MSKITKDWVEAYFSYGVDIVNRKVFLFDGVDEDSIGYVIKGLYLMEADHTKVQMEKGEYKPIELFIGSFGGSEYEMWALYDVIGTLNSPIHTTAIGKCMSAAPLLVCRGEPGHRYATPNTWFMVHQSWEDWGERRTDEIKKELKHYDAMAKRWYDLMAEHSGQTAAFWKKHCECVGDKYFSAYQAQEWGLIDHVWDEKDGEA
ncbi:MAG: ATP-dependent Clp protease proteolytic subunit [Hydrogenophaga sp.]|uniref:ATP-dependent Clp protease proteolytic subunit n=1 Tax=Hydrogenophaga sp. TaxID=1904254 RepID=UPI00260E689A|nr:ATP-dependent Clp protease proteolytic subunit [Hydrogenophaga sp.]MCV0439759.1 ATP-dependent Clp protease proteolytic subunit [Hydrogenophaga sp.]